MQLFIADSQYWTCFTHHQHHPHGILGTISYVVVMSTLPLQHLLNVHLIIIYHDYHNLFVHLNIKPGHLTLLKKLLTCNCKFPMLVYLVRLTYSML